MHAIALYNIAITQQWPAMSVHMKWCGWGSASLAKHAQQPRLETETDTSVFIAEKSGQSVTDNEKYHLIAPPIQSWSFIQISKGR